MSDPGHQIETLSGSMFDFDDPHPKDVDIDDIAIALGNTCRFGGHVKRYYSVAEHAVLVYRLVRDAGYHPETCLAALHHDDHEAYLGDWPTPLKSKVNAETGGLLEDLAAHADRAISSALFVDLLPDTRVKAADTVALSWEAAVLKPSGQAQRHGAWVKVDPEDVPAWAVIGYTPAVAAHRFLCFHREAIRACS